MSFNLNKNEDSSAKADPSKSATSKFDLSKGAAGGIVEEKSIKSRSWLFALLGVLLLGGGGAWYFLSKPNSNAATSSAASTNVDTAPSKDQNKISTTIADTTKSSSSLAENSTTQNKDSNDSKNSGTSIAASTVSSANPNSAKSTASGTPSTISGTNLSNKIPASFAKGSALVSNIDKAVVKEIISYLEKNPNATVSVNGYASSEGTLPINQKISQSRADAFKKYLISKGISDKRIIATGKGVDSPIANNDTEEGRQKNRRIEIALQ